MLVGSLLVSRISDNFGRKVAIFMSLGFQVGVSSRSSTSHFIFFTSRNSTNSPRFCVPKVAGHQMVGEREIVNGIEEKLNPSDVQGWGGAVLTLCQLRTAFGQD